MTTDTTTTITLDRRDHDVALAVLKLNIVSIKILKASLEKRDLVTGRILEHLILSLEQEVVDKLKEISPENPQ